MVNWTSFLKQKKTSRCDIQRREGGSVKRIWGRVLHIGHLIARRLELSFSPEAFWRLEEMGELRRITSQAAIHQALWMYEQIIRGQKQDCTTLQLLRADGRFWEVEIADLLSREEAADT